jgi:hypothetical protein
VGDHQLVGTRSIIEMFTILESLILLYGVSMVQKNPKGPDHQVESVQLRTDDYEMIIAQYGNYTLVVIQNSAVEFGLLENQEVVGTVDEKLEA